MRLGLLSFFLYAACAPSAFATNLYQNFIILEGSGLDPIGGTFAAGGTYSGTFSVNEADLPTGSSTVSLANVDVTTTTAGTFSGTTYTNGVILLNATVSVSGETLDEYGLHFQTGTNILFLFFIEVPNTFQGGQIADANEQTLLPIGFRVDSSGDAVAIDPAFITPEPGSIGMGGTGLALLGAAWCRRKSGRGEKLVNVARASELEAAPADIVLKTK
jgi:hypothetical protein